jgi:ubiquinol-cytochrome c reductase cytochrome c1 subunit
MNMKKFLMMLALFGATAAAALSSANEAVKLDRAPIDVGDLVSLQSGARTFVNNCLNCHSASLMRYNRLRDLGLTEAQIKDNLLFTAEKVGENMNIAMPKGDAKEWFGAAPPDLSVIARARGADWIYSYLRGFYRDDSRPTGWNNTVFPNVGMPHVLWTLQGQRSHVEEVVKTAGGEPLKDGHGNEVKKARFEVLVPGSQSALQYDHTVRDLTAFLVWMGEPGQLQRKQVGFIVLMVLGFMLVLAWLLKREFWKDVH